MAYAPASRSIPGAAYFVDRILKGAKPPTFPSSSHEFELVINLKTAKALGSRSAVGC